MRESGGGGDGGRVLKVHMATTVIKEYKVPGPAVVEFPATKPLLCKVIRLTHINATFLTNPGKGV